jgi:CDP-diacylglycerol--serine O-phosphatidyltransferase
LFCGVVAVLAAALGNLQVAALFVLLGIFFDFFDGLAARLLNVGSELGKQLDSLADLVTSGVAPGIVMYQLILKSVNQNSFANTFIENGDITTWNFSDVQLLPFVGFLLPVAAAYRLGKFNLDERQTISFIGLPTPAMSIFVISLPLILIYSDLHFITNLLQNTYFLLILTVFLCVTMNAEIPLFSLKFKNFSIKNNWVELLFLLLAMLGLIMLKIVAIPFIIIGYILLSFVKNSIK